MSKIVIEIDDSKGPRPVTRVTVNDETLSCIRELSVFTILDTLPIIQMTFAPSPHGDESARKAAKVPWVKVLQSVIDPDNPPQPKGM